MSDHEMSIESGNGGKIGWFVAGAVSVLMAIGFFHFASSYFQTSNSIAAEMPPVIIEAN